MRNRLLSCLLILFLSHVAICQDVYDEIAAEVCYCMEDATLLEREIAENCMKNTLIEFLPEVMKHQNAKNLEGIDAEELGLTVAFRLNKICDKVQDIEDNVSDSTQESLTVDSSVRCNSKLLGDFYYFIDDSKHGPTDTTFVSFTDNMYYERILGGKTYSHLKYNWLGDCQFELVFVESNDPVKKYFSKVGEVYSYTILNIQDDHLILSTSKGYKFKIVRYTIENKEYRELMEKVREDRDSD